MPEYVLVARRPVRRGVLVRGVKDALYIPAGMQGYRDPLLVPPGMAQFRGRAAGYMQVEPAYERPAYGLGDFRQAVVGLIAGKELDQLMSAVRRLNDEVIRGISERKPIIDGYREAKALLDDAVRRFGPPTIPAGPASIPNVKVLPAYTAMATARKGIQVLARQVQTLGMLDRVFTAISVELTKAGASAEANGIDVTLAQVRRFIRDTDDAAPPVAPEYMGAKRAILLLAKRKYAAAGVDRNAIDNPKWLGLYIQAANEVVPIPQPSPPAGAGLGNPLPVIAAVLIWVVGIVAAAVVASQAIARLIPDQNSKAVTARNIALEAERRKSEELARLRAAGASQAEIDAAMKSIDTSTKEAIAAVPEPKSPLGGILAPIGIVIAAAIGAKAAGVI